VTTAWPGKWVQNSRLLRALTHSVERQDTVGSRVSLLGHFSKATTTPDRALTDVTDLRRYRAADPPDGRDADVLRQEIEQLKGLVGHLKKYARESAIDGARAVLRNYDHPAGIVGRNMKVLYVNRAFCSLLNYLPEDILGQRYTVLLEGNSTDIYNFFKTEAEVVRQRVEVRIKTGESKVYDLTKTVVRLPIANYFFTVFHMHPPGFLDSLNVPDERGKLERYLEQRERDRKLQESEVQRLREEVAKGLKRDQVAEEIRRAHALADELLRR
jgi:PAS domain-containing protein